MQRKRLAALATATLTTVALALPLTAPQVGAEPAEQPGDDAKAIAPDRDGKGRGGDDLTMPWQRKYEDARQEGMEQKLRSGSRADVQKLARGQFAKTAQTGKDKIFVVIAEFGDTRHSAYPDDPEQSDAQRFDGPAHNEIPKPNRKTDNSTLWKADYDRGHYQNMYFKRMKRFYENQSLGKYTFEGDVTEWVKVPFNQARYGRDSCGDIVCNNTWFLIRDALAYWTQGKLEAGWSMQRIQTYLKTFDRQDRYDFDGDGDFQESDGYIDHFQIVHAGGDQADGDPIYGTDAIWSHRWYAQLNPFGTTGPDGGAQMGGVNLGEGGASDPEGSNVEVPDNPTGVWVGDYTIQPENGGLSVFAHEYAHDLGLPDLYDTSGNTGGAENSVGWWSLMSQSRGTLPRDAGIGDRPMPFGAWDKFQLGWLDYNVARAGRTKTMRLRPSATGRGKHNNGLIVLLPDKKVQSELGEPCSDCGEQYYYSDQGNELNNTMTREVDGGTALTAKVRYEIEDGWDYAFLETSTDGGENWQSVPTSESYEGEDHSGFNQQGNGISGNTEGRWVDLSATLPAGTDAIRFRYQTDGAFVLPGLQVDNLTLDGESIGTAESGPEGWSLDGFRLTTGTEVESFLNAYIVENRTYRKWDRPLRHLYNFGFPKRPDKVEFFRNQPGMLVNYWDTSQTDNNVGDHPGEGLVLPVDANPELIHERNGELARPRINSWDSTFTTRRSKPQFLHLDGKRFRLPGQRPVRVFNDRLDYWYDSDEHGSDHPGHYQPGWYSVDVPKTGTRIRIVKVNRRDVMKIRVSK